ncbi:hypothetical protein JAAARDRAFT_43397 [Jaapia argillacea MUCL 33604]|uniref:U1 small nuclear ribonucleoprotein C n=1 Tax=Jaapia argillacea MUCL 33604 TaxID=933084 RepID=A0A067QBC4_9AGAM|nr:hypothetical protein JAAARDRAFT_43397 [Jaapia argillacea MUCL 33604]
MPKHYCDYCDVFLTHDSASVRKAHNNGRNHLANVRDYYASLGHDKAQNIIDQITAAYESSGGPPPGGFGFGPQHLGPPGPGFGGPPPFSQPPFGFGGPPPPFGGPGFPPPGMMGGLPGGPPFPGMPPPGMGGPPGPPGGGFPGGPPPFPPGNQGPPGGPPGGPPFPPPNFQSPPPGQGPPSGFGQPPFNGPPPTQSGPPPALGPGGIHPDRLRMMGGGSGPGASVSVDREVDKNLKQVVAFPTETVYGLGALALNTTAASRIFSTKGRPPDNPLIVHVSSFGMLHSLLPEGYTLSRVYELLIKRFWPGPLTLLFPSDPAIVPGIITAHQPTVAIRMPSHPVARALIAVANVPLAAPSANSSGKPSPTRAEHVLRDLGGKLEVILDGGACGVGLESTVVDGLHEDGNLRVLRPGGVTVEDIEAVIAEEMKNGERRPKVLVHRRDYQDEAMEVTPTTPGMKYRHYSPSVPVTLLRTSSPSPNTSESASSFFASLAHEKTSPSIKIGLLTPSDSPLVDIALVTPGIEWSYHPLGPIQDPAVTAQRLFDGLLTLEKEGVSLILIEEIKEEREGLAVMNRVKKAAGESRWITIG